MKTEAALTICSTSHSLICRRLLVTALIIAASAAFSAPGGVPGLRRPVAVTGQGIYWQVPGAVSRVSPAGNVAPASVAITSSTVDSDLYTGYENAIFAPDDNTVYVAYKRFLSDPSVSGYIPAELRIAKSTDAGDTWAISVVDPDAIEEGDTLDNSVAIDGFGGSVLYVAYGVRSSGLFVDAKLRVAKSTDGGATWTTQTVADAYAGDQNSIRVLNRQTVVVSTHANGPSEGIHTFITRDGGSRWSDTLVAGGLGNGYYTSVGAFDHSSIWVGYYNSLYPDHQDMNAGKRVHDAAWDNLLVDKPSNGIAGLGGSITVAPNRVAYAAYEADTSIGAFVRVASKRPGGVWNVVDVQGDLIIGWNTAIHEFNGKLYLSYWRLPIGGLGLAMFAVSGDHGTSWSPMEVPESRSVTPYIDCTAPSNFTQFESYQTVDPVTFTQPILRVARVGG